MKPRLTLLVLVALATLGCVTKLTVKVDLYKGEVMALTRGRQALAAVLALPGVQVKASQPGFSTESLQSQITDLVGRKSKTLVDAAAPNQKVLAEAKKVEAEKSASHLNQLLATLSEVAGTLKAEMDKVEGGHRYIPGTLDALSYRVEKLLATVAAQSDDLAKMLGPPEQRKDLLAVTSNAAIAGADDSAGRAIGYPVFEKLLPRLLADRLSMSRRPFESFNSIHSTAVGGDAQFVVVREGLVDFQQKSLDFDPTPVIGAGAAMTRLGLKILSAVAAGYAPGLESALPTGTKATKGDTAALNEFEMEQQRATLDARKQEKLIVLDEVLQTINSPVDARDAMEKALLHYRKAIQLPDDPN